MSVSTGSQSSSVNSMQEVMDDMSPELILVTSYGCGGYDSTSSLVPKKVREVLLVGKTAVRLFFFPIPSHPMQDVVGDI